jgi:adenylate cyclase class IV
MDSDLRVKEFIEIEFRAKGNYETPIKNNFKIDEIKTYEITDSYLLFNNMTGELIRLRNIKTNSGYYFNFIKKFPFQGHFIESILNLNESEYNNKLLNSTIIGEVKGNRKVLKFENYEFCIDNIKDLGYYTEFEKTLNSSSEDSIIKAVSDDLISKMNLVGIPNSKIITSPYPFLLGIDGGYK